MASTLTGESGPLVLTKTLHPRRRPGRPRLLLLNPAYPMNFWSWTEVGDITGKKTLMPNLALPTLAALTPTDQFDLTLVDENIEAIDFDSEWDIVGMTGYCTQNDRMFALAEEFRRRNALVVIGGPYASLSRDTVRAHADVLFVGEAEDTWPRFLEDYRRGTVRAEYAASETVDLATSPAPRIDLLPNSEFVVGVVQTSRGCPFACDFCDVIVYLGRRQRHKQPEQVVRELSALHQAGYRAIFLSDDNFTANAKRCREIMAAVAAWNREQPERSSFWTQLSIEVAVERNKPLLDLCVEAGLELAFIGVETSDEQTLLEVHKKQNTGRDLVASLHYLNGVGIQVVAGLIVGFDEDDTDVFERQFDFAQRAGIPMLVVSMLNAPEGTPLEARMRAEGRLTRPMTQLYFQTNIVPKKMSIEELTRGAEWLVNRLYAPEAFLERVATFASLLGDAPILGDAPHEGATPGSSSLSREQWTQLVDHLRRLRRSFSELGPEFSHIPSEVLHLLKRKNPNHAFWILTYYYYLVRVLKKWDIWDGAATAAPRRYSAV